MKQEKDLGHGQGYGAYVRCTDETPEYTDFEIDDPFGDGWGWMREYTLFPGVVMIFYDIHMHKAIIDLDKDKDSYFLAVAYCRQGGVEIEVYKDFFSSVLRKETVIDRRMRHGRVFTFHSGVFVGVTISINLEEAGEELKHALGGLHVDVYELFNKYCPGEKPFVLRRDEEMIQIMEAFFHQEYEYKTEFYRVKFLEMMMHLGAIKLDSLKGERRYQDSYSVGAIKAIHSLITTDLGRHYTMNELSGLFQIPLTTLKECFKEMYGDSIYSYTRRYKMNHAAHHLEEHHRTTVLELSKMYGYDAPTKFTEAFHKVIGMTPTEYKRAQKYKGYFAEKMTEKDTDA